MTTQKEQVLNELMERAGESTPRPRIEPVRRLINFLGEPQLDFEVVHVGGTNGKTSTARAIEILLRAHGIKTGLFTSPHLIDFAERIQVDGEPISDERLYEAWQEMQPALKIVDEQLHAEGQSRITFFEALVALAMVAFTDAPVEVAVIEVGMGGEWDATNVVSSKVSVLTPIDIDHALFLGDKLNEIAATKSKIIKPDSITVTANQEPAVLNEIFAAAEKVGADVHAYGRDFELTADIGAVGGRMFSGRGLSGHEYKDLLLPLFGKHQSENALLAIAAVETLFGADRALDQEVIEIGFSNLESPGRLQSISVDPAVIVDSAHNPHGAKALVGAVREHFAFEELLLVTGVFDDKDQDQVIRELSELATRVHVTGINSERATDPAILRETFLKHKPALYVDEFDVSGEALEEAYRWAQGNPGRLVLVAGSVFLAGEAIAYALQEGWQQ